MDAKNNELPQCKVCNMSTSSFHYLSRVCRSCSAFFRRSQQNKKSYVCRRAQETQCRIDYRIPKMCKYCRFYRCTKAGMVWKKTENSESSGQSNSKDSIKCSPSDTEEDHNILFKLPSQEGTNEKTSMNSLNLKGHFSEETKNATTIKNSQVIFDTSSLLSDIRNIIHGPGLKVPVELEHNVSILQTLCYGMQRLFDAINYRPAAEIAIREELEFKTYITFHRKICLKLAETLMYLPQFSSLAKSDKANLFNTLLPFFLSIERVYSSLLVFGHDNPKTLILFDDVQGYDERFAILSDAELPENSKKQLFSLFRNCNEFLLNQLYLPLKKLKLTITEFSFFIGLFLFSVEDIVDITDELREAGSRAIQLINNDIHNYYCKNRTDYAHRITEIVRLISKATCYCSMKGETISVAQLMGVFDTSKMYLEKLGDDNPLLLYLKS